MSSAAKAAKHPKQDEEMRQRIIDASIVFMRAHGSDRLSMVDVARTAKVARATVYNYFESKEALIEAAENSLGELLWERLTIQIEKHDKIEEKIGAIAVFLCNIWADREHTPWFGFLSPTDEATLLASKASDHIQQLADFIMPLLIEAQKKKQVRSRLDIDQASSWAARLVYSFALEHRLAGPKEITGLFKNFLISGFGPIR